MHGSHLGTVLDLHLAAATLGHRKFWFIALYAAEEIAADIHRDLVFLILEAVGACHAAAVGFDLFDLDAGHCAQQLQPWSADTLRLHVAWCMIGEAVADGAKVGSQFSGVLQSHE